MRRDCRFAKPPILGEVIYQYRHRGLLRPLFTDSFWGGSRLRSQRSSTCPNIPICSRLSRALAFSQISNLTSGSMRGKARKGWGVGSMKSAPAISGLRLHAVQGEMKADPEKLDPRKRNTLLSNQGIIDASRVLSIWQSRYNKYIHIYI